MTLPDRLGIIYLILRNFDKERMFNEEIPYTRIARSRLA
jgi:hypothetical protein